jgi:hypothetical protein
MSGGIVSPRYHNYELASAAFQIGIVLCSAAVITGLVVLAWLAGAIRRPSSRVSTLAWRVASLWRK